MPFDGIYSEKIDPAGPVGVTFLYPLAGAARKEYTRTDTAAGPGWHVRSYGNGKQYRRRSDLAGDIEALHGLLSRYQSHNCFLIRGTIRPDAPDPCRRLMAGAGATVLDTPSRLVTIDIDGAPAPADLDLSDPLAVGEYCRARLPEPLQDISCVVQLSGSHTIKPGIRAHLFFLAADPLTGDELRRWLKQYKSPAEGRLAIDPATATANQPIYFARPLFHGAPDPLPARIALLLGTGGDAAKIIPPAPPERPAVPESGAGVRDPGILGGLAASIRRAQARHPAILAAGFTAGGYVAGGACTLEEARAALWNAAVESGSDGAERALESAILAGMARPIYLTATPPPTPPDDALDAEEAHRRMVAMIAATLDAPEPTRALLRAAAGLGKSTATVAAIIKKIIGGDRTAVEYFVPSYDLAAELVAVANRLWGEAGRPGTVATAIRGREHQREGLPALCAKSGAVADLRRAGLGNRVVALLCGKAHPVTHQRACPHFQWGECGYFRQFNDPAPVKVLAHEWLTLPARADDAEAPGLVVLDERFDDAAERLRSWPLARMTAANGIYRDAADAVTEGRLADLPALRERIEAEIAAQESTLPGVHPEMPATVATAALRKWAESRPKDRPPVGFLRACLTARRNSLWSDGERIRSAAVDPLTFIPAEATVLVLDATAAPGQVAAALPGVAVTDLSSRRNARFIQVTDSAYSYHRLEEDHLHLSARLALAVHLAVRRHGPNGAVIAPKFWIEAHGHRLPEGVQTAHFGALRGLDRMKSCDWLFVISRPQPPPGAIEAQARAWYPDEELTLPGRYENQRVTIGGDAVTRQIHVDPRCNELLEAARDAEVLQAVDRLRLLHRTTPATVYLIGSLPLPLDIDTTCALDALTLPGRLAEAMLRDGGCLRLERRYLSEQHPDLFETAKEAERQVGTWRASFKAPNPNIDTLLAFGALKLIQWRPPGKRGHPASAVLIGDAPRPGPALAEWTLLDWLTGDAGKSAVLPDVVDVAKLATSPDAPADEAAPVRIAHLAAPASDPTPEADPRSAFVERVTAELIAAGWAPWNAAARADSEWRNREVIA